MPSWMNPGILSVEYDCDNKHNKTQSYTDIVMELPMQCDDVGDLQPVLIRWIKQSGAQFPDTPHSPPTVLSSSSDSVRLGLVVPQSHGNLVTSLVLEIIDSSDLNATTTKKTISRGSSSFQDGETVEYEIQNLDHSGVLVRYAAVNVRGQSGFSQYVAANPESNTIFTWWVIVCIVVGSITVISVIVIYIKRKQQRWNDKDDYDMPDRVPTPMERTPIFGQSISMIEEEYIEMDGQEDEDE